MPVAQVDLSSSTVLTLDDDYSMRSIIRAVLKGCGCRNVLSIGDGRAALDMLREHHVRLVICDMQMEPMDGLEFMRCARDHPRGRDMAAIMLTAGKQPADRAALAPLRIGAWLFKPISTTKLLEGINSVLGGKLTLSEPEEMVARNIAAIGQRYGARLNADIGQLESAMTMLRADTAAQPDAWGVMRKTLHSIKGQAGTFGYGLVTALAGRGQEILDDTLTLAMSDEDDLEVNRALHAIITAMRMLEGGRMLGDGGDAGTNLLAKLDAFILPIRQRLHTKLQQPGGATGSIAAHE